MDNPGPWDELETSPWGQCLNRSCERIIDANLPGIGGNVWIRDPPTIKLAGDRNIPFPAAILSPFSPSHSPADGTLTAPDIYLRAMLGIITTDARTVGVSLASRLLWYHQAFKLFAKGPSTFDLVEPGADGCDLLYTNVEPGDPRIIEAWQLTYEAEWLAISYRVRYPQFSA